MHGQKHLVQCNCILSQFKNTDPPVFHAFIVFSIIDDNNQVIPNYAQCNNCGIIHKVIDICKSDILKKEDMFSLETKSELKFGLPDKLIIELEKFDCPLYVWQELNFIFQNEKWKDGIQNIVLAKDTTDGETIGKYVSIRSKETFFINKFTRKDIMVLT